MASIGAHQVLNWLGKVFGRQGKAEAAELYEAVMQRSLSPTLYASGLAEDTFDGRFEAVTLHSALIMRRVRQDGQPGQDLADALYRRVFEGFDHALRERGAGDSSIARKVRGYGERYFGLARAIDAAMDAENKLVELSSVLVRNAVGGGAPEVLAAYLAEMDTIFGETSLESFKSGQILWPDMQC